MFCEFGLWQKTNTRCLVAHTQRDILKITVTESTRFNCTTQLVVKDGENELKRLIRASLALTATRPEIACITFAPADERRAVSVY